MISFRLQASAILIAASLVNLTFGQGNPQPVHRAGHAVAGPAPAGTVNYGRYPQLNAPMYPSPVQYTPSWNGGAIITNQALAPHEMLYPHTYHALYPPFYHKVTGKWIVTPFGVRQHERWELQGTDVTVKYRSQYPLFSHFVPPRHD